MVEWNFENSYLLSIKWSYDFILIAYSFHHSTRTNIYFFFFALLINVILHPEKNQTSFHPTKAQHVFRTLHIQLVKIKLDLRKVFKKLILQKIIQGKGFSLIILLPHSLTKYISYLNVTVFYLHLQFHWLANLLHSIRNFRESDTSPDVQTKCEKVTWFEWYFG